MSFGWKCTRCGTEIPPHKEEIPLYKVEPISPSKRKRGLLIGLLVLVIGIVFGLVGGIRSTGQELGFSCVSGMLLALFGFVCIVVYLTVKEEKILTGVLEKYTCPVCRYTWESEKIKEGVVEPPIAQPTSTDKGLQVKVIDYRTEEQKRVAEEGSQGIGVDPETETLMSLLTSAYQWGQNNRFPLHEEYPQYEQIRSIGERIDRKGGFEAMQRTYYFIYAQNSTLGSLLESFWHLIGDWRR